MTLSPFHAMYTARQLSEYARGANRFMAAYASSDIEIYPYQIAAAMFALRSPYLKGAVLADEGSLGKTYESLLVISQLYFEGHDRILVIVPTPLLRQWSEILENRFSVPYEVVDRENASDDDPFKVDAVVLTTYEYAMDNAELIERQEWNIVVFEEAHRLSKPDNKTTIALKAAAGNAFKLLLTATPMQNSIMDLYGLIEFIDTGALGDADEFYKRYFRKPENYGELTATASRYCFRTLRSQVESYVSIQRRIPVTADYPLSAKEMKLEALVNEYLKKPDKQAFPKMESYDLTLMFNRALASSTFAVCHLADTAVGRVRETELVEIAKLAADIQPKTTGKGKALLQALKIAFVELKKRGANRKAVIFTQSRATLGFLHLLLEDTYKVLAFDGSKSSDYSVIQRFRDDAEILITTDVAAEGFNLEFCSFVVNFDLPYNVLTLEQRIMRCHRQGQRNDTVVLNFLNKNNFADVRMLELINKRVLQFDGIMGMSDDVAGNFAENAADGVAAAFGTARHRKDIETDFQATLTDSECRALMDLTVERFVTQGDTYGDRDGISKPKLPHELDALVDTAAFIRRAAADTDEARKEEIIAITERTRREKSLLNREVGSLKNELRQIENVLSRTAAITDRIDAEKKRTAANRELKKREQSLFMDGLKLDADAEAAIQALTDEANLTALAMRMFAIEITGGGQ